MNESQMRAEYLREIRSVVCAHCIERPDGEPPCGPLGKHCGIEAHLDQFVEEVHSVRRAAINPYLDELHGQICAMCEHHDTDKCPCPLDYLHLLAVQAIEQVDDRRRRPVPILNPNTSPNADTTHYQPTAPPRQNTT